MKCLALLPLFVCACFSSYAQGNSVERAAINTYTIEANKLITYINVNLENLGAYQEDLNAWYVSNSTKVSAAPEFKFSTYQQAELFQDFFQTNSLVPSNPAFNYKLTLAKLNKQILLFDSFCGQLKKITKTVSKEDYYRKVMTILYQIDDMAPEMVNLCYDFSLSCAINYGKAKLPVELERLKNVVGQAKNIIMEIRRNDPVQVKFFLNQLHIITSASSSNQDFLDLKRVGRFELSEAQLKLMHTQVMDAANQIAFWAEQYLQSNYSEDELVPILKSAILAFNKQEGQAGCSEAYNLLIAESKNEYLRFTQEPLFFRVQEKKGENELLNKPQENIDSVPFAKPVSMEVPEIITPVELPEPVSFDENDMYTLDGSLPNNIIIMMDVSASMKLTGKLPLLKSSILHLVDIMRREDRLSLIAYSGKAEVLIANAGTSDKNAIKTVLDTLHSSGGTDIKKGLSLGYETALVSYMENGNNRIIIATDGKFGVRKDLLELVESNFSNNIILSIFQFNETKKELINESLQNLAFKGRGSYQTITNSQEALKVLMQEVKQK